VKFTARGRRQTPLCWSNGIALSRFAQPGGNGIVLDVMLDALKFIGIANRMIVALVLPKRLACPMQEQVRTSGRGRLKRVEKFRYTHLRREEQCTWLGIMTHECRS
jgi:hypothetical protein